LEAHKCAELILLQEKRCSFLPDNELLLFAHFSIFLLLFCDATRAALCTSRQADVVLLENSGDLLVGLGTNHDFFGFLGLLFIARLHGGLQCSAIVLQ
jgi:hypothetical protein